MKQYLSYTLIFLRSVLYTPFIRLEPNPFCVPESHQFIVAAAAAAATVRLYLSFLERLPRIGVLPS